MQFETLKVPIAFDNGIDINHFSGICDKTIPNMNC